MLKFNFKRIFRAKSIDKPYSYLVKAGYSASFATRVVNDKVRQLNLENVEKLCEMLQCSPNDLLEWIPGQNFLPEQYHPLSALRRVGQDSRISQMLYNIPVDRLADVEQLINKVIGK